MGVLVFFLGIAVAAPIDDAARTIEKQVVSPCCYSQTVDQHRSGAASEVRAEIRQMLEEGMGEEAILATLVEQHGTKVLAVPKAEGFNASVWWMPVVAVIVGGIGVKSYLRRTTTAGETDPEPLKRSDRERLEMMLKAET